MRLTKTIKNIIYAGFSFLLLAFFSLLIRKVFLSVLPLELLGYEGLFGNVFAIMALTDLGLETVILYRLIPSFAKGDKEEINFIMTVYKKMYAVIGLIIFFIGLILIPFLKYIITDNNFNWNYVYLIYVIQLVSTLCTYFLAYNRLLFVVSQQEYMCTKIDVFVTIFFNVIRLAVLIVLRSYVLYLLCSLGTNLISNIIITFKAKKEFEYIDFNKKINIKDIKAIGIEKDIKNNLVQKICGTIYGGTDNIIISYFLGIGSVALITNYSLIQGFITNFITRLLKPFQAAIGDYIYTFEEKTEAQKMFKMFDLLSFFIACMISGFYLCLLNPVILLCFGREYQLNDQFVFVFSMNQYILWNHQFLTYYRYSFGRYELDKYSIMFAAVANVIISIILVKFLGMTGVMIGTVIGHLGFWFGRFYVVYSEYIDEKKLNYVYRQIIRMFIWMLEMNLIYKICYFYEDTFILLIYKFVICVFVTTGLNIILFIKTEEMKMIFKYVHEVIYSLKNGRFI